MPLIAPLVSKTSAIKESIINTGRYLNSIIYIFINLIKTDFFGMSISFSKDF